jgi:hypothetical protein
MAALKHHAARCDAEPPWFVTIVHLAHAVVSAGGTSCTRNRERNRVCDGFVTESKLRPASAVRKVREGSQSTGRFLTLGERTMRRSTTTVAAILVAAAIPLFAGSATAAPLSQLQGLKSADVGTVEQVQYRRWNRGRWIGPGAGIAAGVAIGSALAAAPYQGGYYAYGAAPGYAAPPGYYAYGAAPVYSGPQYYWGYGAEAPAPGSSAGCAPDREDNSSYPSWMCR